VIKELDEDGSESMDSSFHESELEDEMDGDVNFK